MAQPTVDELMAAIPYARHLGIVIDSAEPDRVVGHLDWGEELTTVDGIFHGGAMMSLGDTVGAVCAFVNLPPQTTTATSSSSTQLLRAARGGAVTASARPLHRGRTNIVVQTDLTDARERLVAQVTQTQAVLAAR